MNTFELQNISACVELKQHQKCLPEYEFGIHESVLSSFRDGTMDRKLIFSECDYYRRASSSYVIHFYVLINLVN